MKCLLNADWEGRDFQLYPEMPDLSKRGSNIPITPIPSENNSSLSSMLNDENMFKDEAGDGEALTSVIMC